MPKIKPISYKKLIKVFIEAGCEAIRKKGSHHILRCPCAKRAIVIPEYSEIDVEIIKNNLRAANISREEYFEYLERI
ncbi:MAG: type II toxin-antitoxin system HicA family toxin [Candidatus Aminicenantes bacterium]|nr:type II toxin-antitoxin system HicA family toxin [Candidatus Aminicenantes bacterium]